MCSSDLPNLAFLEQTFTVEGLDTALAYDWRLRDSVHGDALFFADMSVRGRNINVERPTAQPPSFETDLSLTIDPGAELVDPRTRSVLQRWDERQLFTVRVTFGYEIGTDRWQATLIGPADPEFGNPPPTLAPPVRCPGLGPDQSDSTDLDDSRTWCLGGRDGTRATEQQVIVNDDYPCGTSRASIFTVGWPVGSAVDGWDAYHFIRDPDGRFDRTRPLPIAYIADGRLPKDAYSTGLTDGEFEIWVSPSAGPKAIWARRSDRIERWPRVLDPWLVIDCN